MNTPEMQRLESTVESAHAAEALEIASAKTIRVTSRENTKLFGELDKFHALEQDRTGS